MYKLANKKRAEGREPDSSLKVSTPPKKPKPVAKDSVAQAKSPARRKLMAKVQEKPAPKPVTNEDISSNWKSFLQVKMQPCL